MPERKKEIDEATRLASLYSYNILDTAEEQDFDALTKLASAICLTPIALISLVDAKRQWFKSHTGLQARETPIEQSFCAHAIASFDDIMIVTDAKKDERFAYNPLVTGEPNITFYAGVPLITEDGVSLGTLCVIDHEKKELTAQQTESLKTLARLVVDKLELRRKMLHLENINKELLSANVLIQKFAAMAAHDIKNPLSSILLTSQALKMRHEKLHDDGSLKLVDLNISSAKHLLELVNDMLEYSKTPSLLLAKKQHFNLTSILKKITALLYVPYNFEILFPGADHEIDLSIIAFEQVFINLLSNAIRYNDKENGKTEIRFKDEEAYYKFEVEDNGIGIDEEYIEKIFNNNFTLNKIDRFNRQGTGIGLSTVKELVAALGGSISVSSEPGVGSTFYIAIKK
jgi:signal transduction histidine kinase